MRCLTHRVAALVAFTVLTLPATAAAQGVAGVASPLSARPVTNLPAAPVAVVPGEPTSAGEATEWVLGGRAVWEVTIARSGTGTVTSTTPLPPGADAVALVCGSLRPDLAYDDFSEGFLPLRRPRADVRARSRLGGGARVRAHARRQFGPDGVAGRGFASERVGARELQRG